MIVIGLLHTGVGLQAFRSRLADMFAEGLVDTADASADRGFAFWFLACGLVWMILGAFIDWAERSPHELPRFLGWILLAFASLLILVMPVSGMWLLLIPAVGLIAKSRPSKA